MFSMELDCKRISDEVVLVMEIAIEQGEGAVLKCKLERDLL